MVRLILTLVVLMNLLTNIASVGAYIPLILSVCIKLGKLLFVLFCLKNLRLFLRWDNWLKFFFIYELLVTSYGLVVNTEYFEVKNTIFYHVPQIITAIFAYKFRFEILSSVDYIVDLTMCVLLLSLLINVNPLAIQKTFAYVYLLGFFGILSKKWSLVIKIVFICILLSTLGIESRITIVRLLILMSALLLVVVSKLRIVTQKRFLYLIVILAVGLVVKMSSSFNGSSVELNVYEVDGYNVFADTRSVVFANVFASANTVPKLVFGQGASASYKTHFDGAGGTLTNLRYRSEIDLLNKFLYGGLLYVFLFVNLFYQKLKTYRKKHLVPTIFLVGFLVQDIVENTSELSLLWIIFWSIYHLRLHEIQYNYTNTQQNITA